MSFSVVVCRGGGLHPYAGNHSWLVLPCCIKYNRESTAGVTDKIVPGTQQDREEKSDRDLVRCCSIPRSPDPAHGVRMRGVTMTPAHPSPQVQPTSRQSHTPTKSLGHKSSLITTLVVMSILLGHSRSGKSKPVYPSCSVVHLHLHKQTESSTSQCTHVYPQRPPDASLPQARPSKQPSHIVRRRALLFPSQMTL